MSLGRTAAAWLCFAAVLGGAVGPAAATSCQTYPAAGFDSTADGGWLVLVGPTAVEDIERDHRFSVSPAGERRAAAPLAVPNASRTTLRDVHRGADGQWYLLAGSRVVVYDADWQPTGREIDLGDAERSLSGAGGIAQTDDGAWWVALDGEVRRYTADWNLTATRQAAAKSVATDGGRAWVLGDDGRVSRAEYAGGEVQLSSAWRVAWEAAPRDLARTDEGWAVLDGDGRVHRYTSYGQYTGESTRLPVKATTGCSDYYAFELLVLPVGIAVWGAVPLATVVLRRRERWAEVAAAVALGTAGAATFYYFWLPRPLSLVYWLPDALIGGLLVLAGGALLFRVRRDRWLLGLLTVLLAPLGAVAVAFSPVSLLALPLAAAARRAYRGWTSGHAAGQ